jgi:prepilin-type N-terminal cleavage/methylation domain-containing protein/prepilin-type processing-associated H-X9-DG protein
MAAQRRTRKENRMRRLKMADKGRRNAFTLIELLVVIAIIAILAAILFPVFAQARGAARKAACQSNLKQIGTATMMYAQDYDESYPGGWNQAPGHPNGGGDMMWRVVLQPYIQKYGNNSNLYDSSGNFGVYWCPSTPGGGTSSYGPSSYGYNAFGGYTQGWKEFGGGHAGFPGATMAAVFRPAELVMFADAATVGASRDRDPNFNDGSPGWTGCAGSTEQGPYRFNPEVWREEWSVDWDFGVPGNGTPNSGEDWGHCRNGGRRPIGRHNGFFNALYGDGHVKAVRNVKLTAAAMSRDDILHNHE